jgi:excisionase family DNA binding protein
MPTPIERPGYLQLREAAKWASVSTKTVQRWIKRGLPHYSSSASRGGRVLIRLEDLDQFIQGTKRQAPQIDLNKLVDETFREIIGTK